MKKFVNYDIILKLEIIYFVYIYLYCNLFNMTIKYVDVIKYIQNNVGRGLFTM